MHQKLRGNGRAGHEGSGSAQLFGDPHADLKGFAASNGEFTAAHGELKRIAEGCHTQKGDLRAGNQTQFQEPSPKAAIALDGLDRHYVANGNGELSLKQWLLRSEKEYLRSLLIKHKGAVSLTAVEAKVDNKTLYRKMRRHGLHKESFKDLG